MVIIQSSVYTTSPRRIFSSIPGISVRVFDILTPLNQMLINQAKQPSNTYKMIKWEYQPYPQNYE